MCMPTRRPNLRGGARIEQWIKHPWSTGRLALATAPAVPYRHLDAAVHRARLRLSRCLVLSNQISSTLFDERVNQISKESERGLSQARSILESASTTDRASTQALVKSTLSALEGDGATVVRDFVLTAHRR